MKDIEKVFQERPNVNDYDLKPYGYIVALTNYTDKLEKAIKKAKPNMDKIKDVDKHLDDIR